MAELTENKRRWLESPSMLTSLKSICKHKKQKTILNIQLSWTLFFYFTEENSSIESCLLIVGICVAERFSWLTIASLQVKCLFETTAPCARLHYTFCLTTSRCLFTHFTVTLALYFKRSFVVSLTQLLRFPVLDCRDLSDNFPTWMLLFTMN